MLQPEIQGGLFIGEGQSIPGLNKPFWAKITDFDGVKFYTWSEYYLIRISTDPEFIFLPGGRFGTITNNPAMDANGAVLELNSYVLLQRAYFDATYDWVYLTVGPDLGEKVQDTRYCTILTQAITVTQTTIYIQSAALFPAVPPSSAFQVLIDEERLLVTATAGLTWAVIRGYGGTVATEHDNYSYVCQPKPAIRTNLLGGITATTTLLSLSAVPNFPPFGRFYIRVDSEEMLVVNGAGTTLWTVERAKNDTDAAAHLIGAEVYQILPDTVRHATQIIFDQADFIQPGTRNSAVRQEVAQFVKITSTTITANGYYPAVMSIWDSVNRVWIDSYPVWAKDVNS